MNKPMNRNRNENRPASSVPNPAEQLKSDISSARNNLNSLIDRAKLSSIRNDVSELETDIATLPSRIEKIRIRNYAFNKALVPQAQELQKQWSPKRGSIQNNITMESNTLGMLLRPLESRVAALSLASTSRATVDMIKNELDSYEKKVDASERAVREMYSGIQGELDKIKSQLSKIEQTLDWGESASFGFLPGEGLVVAVKAVWTRDQKEDKEDPEGILFLTDQRMIFEQREEVATKKVLFVTIERQKVQQLQFEFPVFSVSSVKASKQGVFKNEDWLDLELESGAFARNARLHLDGQDSSTWQQLITQAKNRELDNDRAIEVDQAAVEKVKSAPEKCPNCGGALTKPVLRGMEHIICDFCGNKIKL